jgi:predicted Abi (CAAX) family protease
MAHQQSLKLQFATTSAVSSLSIGWTAGIIGCLGLLAIPFGFTTGFFVRGDVSWRHTILLSIRLLFVPSTLEEYLWRVILQPYPTESISTGMRVLFCTMSTLAFVAAHPLLANTIWTRGRNVFGDWRFLLLTFLLGIACTLAYQLSGSVWMPVAVHWTAVVAWIAFLGGEERRAGENSSNQLPTFRQGPSAE